MKTLVPYILILILVVALIFSWNKDETSDFQRNDEELKQLKDQNDSLLLINAQLDSKIEVLKQSTDSLKAVSRQNKKIINYLNSKQNESIKAIDHFNHAELLDFFAKLKPADTTTRR